MNNIFRFKYFEINQNNAAHKVGTDAMLLGAFLNAKNNTKNALEIGTGTGVIALMLAQKSNFPIDVVEISESHAEIAKNNFDNSNYSHNLKVFPLSLQAFSKQNTQKYDLIFSNPPYFEVQNNYKNEQRKNSRQTEVLRFEDLFFHTENLMSENAEFWVVLPYSSFDKINKTGLKYKLFCNLQIRISSYKNSEKIRGIFVFSKIPKAMYTLDFYIYEKEKIYSKNYILLTEAYHFPAIQQENL